MTADQITTDFVSAAAIMRTEAFHRGVAEVRGGRAPDYDQEISTNASWNYERGRQWATVAPPGLPVLNGKRVNPEALSIFENGGML